MVCVQFSNSQSSALVDVEIDGQDVVWDGEPCPGGAVITSEDADPEEPSSPDTGSGSESGGSGGGGDAGRALGKVPARIQIQKVPVVIPITRVGISWAAVRLRRS